MNQYLNGSSYSDDCLGNRWLPHAKSIEGKEQPISINLLIGSLFYQSL